MAAIEKKVMSTLIYCCDPFHKIRHKTLKNVRPVQNWMCEIRPEINPGMKICDSCRKQLAKEKKEGPQEIMEEDNELREPDVDVEIQFIEPNMSIEFLNKSLLCIEESPISKKRICDPRYCKRKLEKAKKSLIKKLVTRESSDSDEESDTDSVIIKQLKEKFEQTQSRSEKFLILTVLPKSWSCQRIQKEFSISNRMARKVKALVKEKGILSTPDPKLGRTLDDEVLEKVQTFYNSDDVSRMMPGMKDCVTVKTEKKTHVRLQKRLILGNLKEIYQLFKKVHPTAKIGFSKFAELRPKNCILAGGSGTHCVCVCTYHQNVKLMISGGKLKDITLNDGSRLNDYKICLNKIMCQVPTPQCHLGTCKNCPGVETLKEQLLNNMEEEMIESITYKQWVSVDRCTFETFIKNADEFIEILCEQLVLLKTHSFIAHQQSEYYSHLKENLQENQALITLDFSENYSFVLQDEAQSFHWHSKQATVHPFAVYYHQKGEIKFKSFVVISECLIHNTIAVHTFQRKLISFLKENVILSLEKVFYFSDGSGAQYKNRKNFLNLCYHKEDFDIYAEWHFYATAHGKGVCDGLGGTVKRLAAKASLQRPYTDQITTPLELFHWCQDNIPSIQFLFSTNEEYRKEEMFLKRRFEEAKTIAGTQRFHSFIPSTSSPTEIVTRIYSFSNESEKFDIGGGTRSLEMAKVTGFVTCEYDKKWWLAYVLSVDFESGEATVSFLHPPGPATSFVYPASQDVLTVWQTQILTRVEPRTATGRTYTLTKNEMFCATNALEKFVKANWLA